jgi:hypothetical protein
MSAGLFTTRSSAFLRVRRAAHRPCVPQGDVHGDAHWRFPRGDATGIEEIIERRDRTLGLWKQTLHSSRACSSSWMVIVRDSQRRSSPHIHRDDDPGAPLRIGGRLTGDAARNAPAGACTDSSLTSSGPTATCRDKPPADRRGHRWALGSQRARVARPAPSPTRVDRQLTIRPTGDDRIVANPIARLRAVWERMRSLAGARADRRRGRALVRWHRR